MLPLRPHSRIVILNRSEDLSCVRLHPAGRFFGCGLRMTKRRGMLPPWPHSRIVIPL